MKCRLPLTLTLAALVLGLASPTLAEPPTSTTGLRASAPVSCGLEDVVLRGRYIVTEGNAVESRGTCDITIVDSYIEAGSVAVLVASTGDIEIRNSHIEGGEAALLITSTGDIEYSGSRIRGGVASRSTGDLEDRGGNDVSGRASSAAGSVGVRAGGAPAAPGSVIVGEGGVTIPGVIQVDPSGVTAAAGSVEIGAGGVRVDGGPASVTVDGDAVRLDSGGAVVVTGNWRERRGSGYGSADMAGILIDLGATREGGQLRLQLGGDVLFDSDSAEIRGDAAAQLSQAAHVLRVSSAGQVLVAGHTDSLGEPDYNMKLSLDRAVAVMQWLNRNEGIPADIMRGTGLGATKPIAHNTMPDGSDNPIGRASNRRVEIHFAARE